MKKKTVLGITGIRSEYDILFPILKVLKEDDKHFDVKIVVSGAHLSDWHGNTIDYIKQDGIEIVDFIDNLLSTNRVTQRPKGVGILTYALSQTVERVNPDFMIVVGDREESIATAIVGNYMEKLVCHVGGGDPVYGNSDDPIRFAVSKLSHIHFTSTTEYAKNLLKIGEEEFRVFCVGNPIYYSIHNTEHLSLDFISSKLDFDISDGNYIVLIKHPLSSELKQVVDQIKTTLEAVIQFCKKHNFKTVGIYPNTDPGSYDIVKLYKEYEQNNPKEIKFFKTIPRNIFVNLIRNTKCIVGNSSMGILEAPYYKVPVVNIGNRQRGRLNAGNVEFVDYNLHAITSSLEKAVFDIDYRNYVKNLNNPYGDENAPYKIRDILREIDVYDKKWYVKEKLV